MWLLLAYKQSVGQMGIENAKFITPELCISFWRTSRTIPTWPSKNLFHNSLFRVKRGSMQSNTSILSKNNKACNWTNESVKIVISLRNSVFPISSANNRQPLKCTKYLQSKSHIVHVMLWALRSKYYFQFILNIGQAGYSCKYKAGTFDAAWYLSASAVSYLGRLYKCSTFYLYVIQ